MHFYLKIYVYSPHPTIFYLLYYWLHLDHHPAIKILGMANSFLGWTMVSFNETGNMEEEHWLVWRHKEGIQWCGQWKEDLSTSNVNWKQSLERKDWRKTEKRKEEKVKTFDRKKKQDWAQVEGIVLNRRNSLFLWNWSWSNEEWWRHIVKK